MEAILELTDNLDISASDHLIHEPSMVLLEQMLVTYCDGSTESLEVRALGCDLLDQVYASREEWISRIRLLEKRIEDADEPLTKAEHYKTIAEYYERDDSRYREAYDALRSGISQGYQYLNLVDEFERLTHLLDTWAETCTFLYQSLTDQHDADEDTRRDMVQRVASLYEERLGDPHLAIQVYEFGRNEEPEDLVFLRELNRLYELTQQPEALVQVLELRIELEPNASVDEVSDGLDIGPESAVDESAVDEAL